MKPLIGLFGRGVDTTQTINRLKQVGIGEDKINFLTQESAIRRLLGCEPRGLVSRYIAWGAFFGIAIYGIFGLVASFCQCNLLHFEHNFGIGTILALTLGGAFVGGIIGCLIGAAESEKDSHLYVQGARIGGRVIVVQTGEEDFENVKLILEQANVSGVRPLPQKKSML
jgi:hypothetical protein